MIKYKFKCPCGGTVIEMVCESWVETIINGFDELDHEHLSYGRDSTADATFDRYQCSECGEELRWPNMVRVQELDLYEFLKEKEML